MTDRGHIAFLLAVAMFVLGTVVIAPQDGSAADRVTSVMGIVKNVQGTSITVGRTTYDIQGIPLRDERGRALAEISSIRGMTVEIGFRNRKIVSVMVYRTVPQ